MRVIRDRSGEYGDCAYEYLHLEEWGDDNNEEPLFYGYATAYNDKVLEFFRESNRKVYFQGEQPCGLFSTRPSIVKASLEVGNYFDEVYSFCPYSASWMNLIHGYDKYRAVNFPHHLKYAAPDEEIEKPLDVIYWGNVPEHGRNPSDILNILENIVKFNHSFYTLGYGVPPKFHKYVTGVNVPRPQMWDRLRKSKIMVTSNLLYLTDAEAEVTKALPRWQENEAFIRADEKIMPQVKTRPIEAIFNKTLVLLKEDPWRVFDHWFTPDEDFLYYKNDEDLEGKIRDITNDWDNYKHITNNAYKKAVELYTSEKLYRDIESKVLR